MTPGHPNGRHRTGCVPAGAQPGPMTLDGTNSYLLSAARFGVVDRGRSRAGRRRPPRRAGRGGSGRADPDHPSASRPHRGGRRVGAADRGAGPGRRSGALHRRRRRSRDGEIIAAAGVSVQVIATPGHTTDSVSFLLRRRRPDRVGADRRHHSRPRHHRHRAAGRQPGVVPRLAATARRPRTTFRAARTRAATAGPVRGCRASIWRIASSGCPRSARCWPGSVRRASVGEVTDAVYTDIDPSVRFAAEHSVAAQLAYLRGTGTRRAVTDRRHAVGLDGVLPLLACPHCVAALLAAAAGWSAARPDIGSTWPGRAICRCWARRPRTDTADSADMVAARAVFLGEGHYRPIADAIADRVGPGRCSRSAPGPATTWALCSIG